MTDFHAPISEQIWDQKYRFEDEPNIQGTWLRVATALAQPEKDPNAWITPFYDAMKDFKFIPAGRIIAGAGTERDVTLFNCFVMGTIPDSMSGIFDMLKEAALTMQQGGGIGYDFSTIRPKGAPVKGVSADASGPLTFMDVWDAMCRTVMSAGARRGAMMATMRCDHPDILDFVNAKRDSARLRMFNLSVLVTDEFMAAVENDEPWRFKWDGEEWGSIRARDLWDEIMQATYDVAEPGVIFIDRINNRNPLRAVETISATNPCGEQPLPPYGACLLGSINLAAFVENPYSRKPKFKREDLKDVVSTAVRMLDNVNDVSNFPLPKQAKEAKLKRRIGLGVTGLADALLMLGVEYGSEVAVKATATIMECIETAAITASNDLGIEKGQAPVFSEPLRGNELSRRNSHLTSIAPTGTISLLAGNVSSGIEPIFAPEYTRKVLEKDGSKREEVVMDYAIKVWRDLGNEGFPPNMVTAQDLPPEAHVKMQAACQKYVDSSISKTINLPEDISFEDFKDVYKLAYDMGCKGCTTYRPNAVTGSVLSVDTPAEEPDTKADDEQKLVDALREDQLPVRDDALTGTTYKLKWPESAHAIYVTINDIVEDGQRRPFEIFINSKNMDHYAWTVALTRMVSAVFRRGGNVEFVAEELKAVFDPRGGAWVKGRYIPSVLAAIGDLIETHISGLTKPQDSYGPEAVQVDAQGYATGVGGPKPGDKVTIRKIASCPSCGSWEMRREGGCLTCLDCGHSECG